MKLSRLNDRAIREISLSHPSSFQIICRISFSKSSQSDCSLETDNHCKQHSITNAAIKINCASLHNSKTSTEINLGDCFRLAEQQIQHLDVVYFIFVCVWINLRSEMFSITHQPAFVAHLMLSMTIRLSSLSILSYTGRPFEGTSIGS
jgi:hypothetical protein